MTSLFCRDRVPRYTRPGEEPGVAAQPVERKLAAIFAADIAGYSRLMAHDEVGTLARLKAVSDLGVPNVRASYEATYLAGLRKAGMPEE